MRFAHIFLTALLLPTVALAATQRIAVLPAQLEGEAKTLVPRLVDDYILTAVQGAGNFEVVGPDDINAMISFEQQKELVGCDDMACIVDLAGALGVDKLVAVRIARIGNEWATTAKLINIRETRVEARSTEFVSGDTKQLLQAMPTITGKLFAGAASHNTQARTSTSKAGAPAPSADGDTPPRKSLVKRPWFWILIGAAVLTVGVVALSVYGSSLDYDSTYGSGPSSRPLPYAPNSQGAAWSSPLQINF